MAQDLDAQFEAWWNEVEGFSLRSERAIDDLKRAPEGVAYSWFLAAFQAGYYANPENGK